MCLGRVSGSWSCCAAPIRTRPTWPEFRWPRRGFVADDGSHDCAGVPRIGFGAAGDPPALPGPEPLARAAFLAPACGPQHVPDGVALPARPGRGREDHVDRCCGAEVV